MSNELTPEQETNHLRALLGSAMREDEDMRSLKRTRIETFKNDLDLSPQDEIPRPMESEKIE